MKLLTKANLAKLIANHEDNIGGGSIDPDPVVKFFNPCGAYTALFTEFDEKNGILYGLADYGFGTPELGYASLAEIEATVLPFGLKIERDLHFRANRTISEYAAAAREAGRIAA